MMCEQAELALGALVLGALEPVERAAVQAHLNGCVRCRGTLGEFAELPGLLSRLSPEEAAYGLPEPSPDLLPRMVAAARGVTAERRRRRRLLAVAAAAVLAVSGTAAGLGLSGSDVPAQTVVSATDSSTRVHAMISFARAGVGTSLTVAVSGVAPEEHCQLVVVAADGTREVAAIWVATYAGDARVQGSTRLPREEIREVMVVTDDGRQLVGAPT